MKDRRILITGGAGFIGSHLAYALCEDNEVVVVDNLSTGKIENIEELIDAKRVRFVRGSVTDMRLMSRVCREVDYVFHHAAIASVPKSIKDPLTTNDVGVKGTLVTLLAARDGGVRKVVFASSAGVYGDRARVPTKEESPPDPLSPYALTKVVGEQYCMLFNRLFGLETISLRYFNVFGPRQDPNSEYAAVIPKFISRALAGKDLPIHGDGRQTRDFTYVYDAVRANFLAAQSDAVGDFNIAVGKAVSVNHLARVVMSLTGREVKIKHEPSSPGDIRHSLADITKASKELGYSPEYSFEEGLKHTIDWLSRDRVHRRTARY